MMMMITCHHTTHTPWVHPRAAACRAVRPQAAPNAGFCAALIALEKEELGSSSVQGPRAVGPAARAAQGILVSVA